MTDVSEMVAHDIAGLVPAMTDAEYEELSQDVRANGVRVPIVLYEGKVLDGRHRLKAAVTHGQPYETTTFEGAPDEAIHLVYSLNLARRHLTKSQLACWAAEILPRFEAEARLRQQAAAERGKDGGRGHKRDETLTPKSAEGLGESRVAVAKLCRVGKDAVGKAKRVKESAPALFDAVKAGATTLEDAAREVARDARAQKQAEQRARPVPTIPPDVRLEVGDAANLPIFSETVDLTVTSPPYGLGKDYGTADDPEAWPERMRVWLAEMYRVTRSGGRLALNVPLDTSKAGFRDTYAIAVTLAKAAGWAYRTTILWNEQNVSHSLPYNIPHAPHIIAPVEMIAWFSRGEWIQKRGDAIHDLADAEWHDWRSGIWTFSGEGRTAEGHPAAYPVELPHRLIKLLSYPGDLVLDPFVGSGTTALAARRLGRRFVGFDISQDYVNSAKRRVGSA